MPCNNTVAGASGEGELAPHAWPLHLTLSQICPLKRPIKWEAVVTFSSPSLKNFSFSVQGGLILELSVAQFCSSGNASHEPTCVDFEVDLEHNHCRYFQGLTCLMQISTRTEHLILDTLKLDNCLGENLRSFSRSN